VQWPQKPFQSDISSDEIGAQAVSANVGRGRVGHSRSTEAQISENLSGYYNSSRGKVGHLHLLLQRLIIDFIIKAIPFKSYRKLIYPALYKFLKFAKNILSL